MRKNLTDINPEEVVTGIYLIKTSDIRTSKNGRPYLSGYIMDQSGEVEFKLWNYNHTAAIPAGTPVQIDGAMTSFIGKKTVIISAPEKMTVVENPDTADLDEIIPAAPVDTEDYADMLDGLLMSIHDKDYHRVCMELFNKYQDPIMATPAGKSVHHAFRHGLLMHTVNIMCLADEAAHMYPILNRDLLLTAAFLHDIGKPLSEFNINQLGLVENYTPEGTLLGHLIAGANIVKNTCDSLNIPQEKTLLLMHCILSHHGQPEYGAAVRPAIPEADVLAKLDMLDAAMEIFRTNLEKLEPGETSKNIMTLDNRRIYKPM